MRAGYGKNTRELLAGEATPKVVIDFGDLPIFDATTYPSILLLEKGKPEAAATTLAATFTKVTQLETLEESLAAVGFALPFAALKPEGWTLERPNVLALMEKLRKAGKPLREYVEGKFYYGIKTGLNEAFVIDEGTRQQLITEDPKSSDLIRPWLRGRDIRKWKAKWAGLYLIYIPWHFEKIDKYLAIKEHLEQFKTKLKKRGATEQGRYEWYELQRYAAEYYREFDKPKIMWRHFTTVPEFIFDEAAHYSNDKSYILPTDDLALLGILNSQVTNFFIRQISPPVRGGFMEMRIIFMEQLPIPSATDTQKAPIIERVQQILADPASPTVPHLEADINQLVYTLYKLTPEETKIIENEQ